MIEQFRKTLGIYLGYTSRAIAEHLNNEGQSMTQYFYDECRTASGVLRSSSSAVNTAAPGW